MFHLLQLSMKKVIFLMIGCLLLLFFAFPMLKKVNQPLLRPAVVNQNKKVINMPVTHTWYSALFRNEKVPLYALPGTYRLSEGGLEIGRPTTQFQPATIFYSHMQDLRLEFENGAKITQFSVVQAGEWDVTVKASNQAYHSFQFQVIKGTPTVFVSQNTQNLILPSSQIENVKKIDSFLYKLKTRTGKWYLVRANMLNVSSNTSHIVFPPQQTPIAITILPDELQQEHTLDNKTWKKITVCMQQKPDLTTYQVQNSLITDDLQVDLQFSQEKNKEFLTTVWPHLSSPYIKKLNNADFLGTYKTSKGELRLTCANQISYQLSIPDLPVDYQNNITKNPELLVKGGDILAEEYKKFMEKPAPDGVYFRGKYIKHLVDMWQVAGFTKQSNIQQQLATKIHALLISEINKFSYDSTTQMVFHQHNEFGSEKGNDHHFHYAYYTYAYSMFYNEFTASEKSKVDNLIKLFIDEGLPAVNETGYPRKIRFLDPFESHSWADAQAVFGDGNNQESTSEALFYWYSMWLWSHKSDNYPQLRTYALFGFYSEMIGRDAYWLLFHNEYLSKNFDKPIISLVWGGKSDYTTWFSPEEDKILGIQLLPIFPASQVSFNLSKIPQSEKENLFNYYDNYYKKGSPNANFHNYYFYLRKVNQKPPLVNASLPNDEYFLRSFDTISLD